MPSDAPTPVQRFGEVVQTHRRRLGLTQTALAERANLHPNHVGYVERGDKKPSFETVIAVCKALGVKPSDLLREIGL